eukprot:354773-Chlamydomonas_euryale.AAC.4
MGWMHVQVYRAAIRWTHGDHHAGQFERQKHIRSLTLAHAYTRTYLPVFWQVRDMYAEFSSAELCPRELMYMQDGQAK